MARLTERQLRERSHAVEGRTVLLLGDEALLKGRALQGIIAAALLAETRDYGLTTLECAKPPRGGGAVKPGATEIMAAAQTRAFLAPTSVVVVREAQRLPAEEERKLAKWLLNVPQDALLVLATGREGSVGKRLADAVAQHGTVVTADLPRRRKEKEAAAAAWAVEEAKAMGGEIEPAAARYLVQERTGPDLETIRSELEKLALYAADAPRITRQHVEEATPRSIEDRIWDLTDAISAGRRARALGLLEELVEERRQAPELVLGSIASHLRSLWQVKALLDRGWKPGASALPESAGEVLLEGRYAVSRLLTGWRASMAARQAQAMAWPTLRGALLRLASCDLAIKEIEGAVANRKVALYLLVRALCVEARRAARN